MPAQPTSPGSCARASSAAEARFRIDRPIVPARAARVFALDPAAARAVRRIAARPWANARFCVCEAGSAAREDDARAGEIRLRRIDGSSTLLSEELAGADVAVVVATRGTGRRFAAAIGRACAAGGIMTAGLVLGPGGEAEEAVAALRPHARVLLSSADEGDLVDLMTALRA